MGDAKRQPDIPGRKRNQRERSLSLAKVWAILRFLITGTALFGVWLIFSFRWDLFSVLSGLIGSFLIAGLTYRIFIAQHEASLNSFVPRPHWLILFLFLLIYKMYASSFKMLIAVFKGKASPRVVYFRTRLQSDLARMVLSNSITLTPGTITLDLNEDHLTVHWFFANTRHSKAAGEAVKGSMEKFLRRVWV